MALQMRHRIILPTDITGEPHTRLFFCLMTENKLPTPSLALSERITQHTCILSNNLLNR